MRDDVIGGGDPFDTLVGRPFEIAVNAAGDLVFFDSADLPHPPPGHRPGQAVEHGGNRTYRFSGDGLAASNAALGPGPLAFDAAGDLFFSDGDHARSGGRRRSWRQFPRRQATGPSVFR